MLRGSYTISNPEMPYLNPDLLNEAVIRTMQHSKVSLYSGVIPSPSSLYKKADYGPRSIYMVSGTRDNPPPETTLASVYMWKRFP